MTTAEPLTFPLAPAGPFDPPRELREQPIARVRYADGKLGWVLTHRAAVRAVLADPRFSARQELRSTPFNSSPTCRLRGRACSSAWTRRNTPGTGGC